MTDYPPDDQDDPETEEDDDEVVQIMRGLSIFLRLLPEVKWFESLGAPLQSNDVVNAEDYLSALGFPDARVALTLDWQEAADAAESMDWNTLWWEAEEQLFAALNVEAVETLGAAVVEEVITGATAETARYAGEALLVSAAEGGVMDDNLLQAAVGAACQATAQALLVIAAGVDEDNPFEDHPFAQKFRLFEHGRWPLGVVGNSFNIF